MSTMQHRHYSMGLAPYRLVGLWSMPSKGLAEANPHAYGREMAAKPKGCVGQCDHCGTAIMHHFIIEDAKGDTYSVGSDCIAKLGDHALVDEATAARQAKEKAKRAAARAQTRQARQQAYEVELQAQRDRNGGQTDDEHERQERIERQERLVQARSEAVEPVYPFLSKAGRFGDAMLEEMIHRGEAPSAGATRVCIEIIAKRAGRKNSKAYRAALPEAEQLFASVTKALAQLG